MDTPKIHMDDPQVDDHLLYFDSESLRIPLSLWGIFSYFLTSKPELEEIDNIESVLLLTPEGPWNPHDSAYAKNEEHMLDWEGNMVEKQTCQKFVLEEVEDNIEMSIGSVVAEAQSSAIDKVYEHISSCFCEFTQ